MATQHAVTAGRTVLPFDELTNSRRVILDEATFTHLFVFKEES